MIHKIFKNERKIEEEKVPLELDFKLLKKIRAQKENRI